MVTGDSDRDDMIMIMMAVPGSGRGRLSGWTHSEY
jgi:hypothetical protein